MTQHWMPVAGALALVLPLLAVAQANRSDAASPGPTPSVLQYHSAFENYKPYRELRRDDWRTVNDAVRTGEAGDGAAVDMSMPGMSMPETPGKSDRAPSTPAHDHHLSGATR